MVTIWSVVMNLVQALALVFAGAITLNSYRAYRRSGEPMYAYAFTGFAMLTGGVLVESVLFTVLGFDIHTVHTAEGVLFVVGFGLLYWSIRPPTA